MNQKFKELAEKSGFMFWTDEPWKPDGAIIDWSSTYDNELEKFAELIIRECAEIAVQNNEDKLSEDYNLGVGKAIKNHFRV